ncbi:MAG: hypothetical protein ACSHW0_09280 [Thalassotalea sp.]
MTSLKYDAAVLKYILSFLLFTSFATFANNTQWSSFGTLGITLADSNTFGYRNDISSDNGVYSGDIDFKSNSLLGGQVETSFTKSFDFIGQAVIRDLIDPDPDDYITMAFLRYTPSAKWSIKAGRLTPDLFRITEYRNINVAYTWANVPNEIYGMIPFKYLDGFDVTYSNRLANGTLNLKFFSGESGSVIHASGNSEKAKLKNLYGLSMIYDKNDWNLQARYTRGEIGNNGDSAVFMAQQIENVPDFLWPNKSAFAEQFYLKGRSAEYFSLSGQKHWDNWLLSFELAKVNSDNVVTANLNSGYISAAYQSDNHTYYGVYAQTSADNYDFNEPVDSSYFPELVYGIESVMNFYSSNQNTLSLGWRWDINANVASKLQINTTEIDSRGATLWINPSQNPNGRTVSSLMYTLSFAL